MGESSQPDGTFGPSVALVLRHLLPLPEHDVQRLLAFAAAHSAIGLTWWLQPKGPDTVHRLAVVVRPAWTSSTAFPSLGW